MITLVFRTVHMKLDHLTWEHPERSFYRAVIKLD